MTDMVISWHQIFIWLVWGFVMGFGWAIATWLVSKILK